MSYFQEWSKQPTVDGLMQITLANKNNKEALNLMMSEFEAAIPEKKYPKAKVSIMKLHGHNVEKYADGSRLIATLTDGSRLEFLKPIATQVSIAFFDASESDKAQFTVIFPVAVHEGVYYLNGKQIVGP